MCRGILPILKNTISAALGMATASRLNKDPKELVAVIGEYIQSVCRFLEAHNFEKTKIHGCMYGVKILTGPDSGTPVLKPWTIACSPGPDMPRLLNKVCDHSHDMPQSFSPFLRDGRFSFRAPTKHYQPHPPKFPA